MIQGRQIEAFTAVMTTGGMTAAAEAMRITQPAVSRLVRDLERATGLTLFSRRANQVIPTAHAHALLDEVKRSFLGLKRIEEFAKDLRSGPGGLLRIVVLPAMQSFVPRFVARFCRDRALLRVIVDSQSSPAIREQVAAGAWDLGVCAAPFQFAGLASTPLEDEAVAVIPVDHPLANRRVVHLPDLTGHDLIVIDKFATGRHPLELALQSMTLGRLYQTPQSMIACTMAAEGAGIAIVDPFSACEFIGRGVVLRRLTPSVIVGAAVVWSSASRLSPVGQEFHDLFVEHARGFARDAAYLSPRKVAGHLSSVVPF